MMMSEAREMIPIWKRLAPWPITATGVILYTAILLYESHVANEPHLWRDLWAQFWIVSALGGPKDLSLSLVQYSVFFFGGFTLLWRSLPTFYFRSPSVSRYAIVGCGVLAIALVTFCAVSDLFDPYGDFTRGQSLLVFGAIYGFALVLLGRALPLIAVMFRKATCSFYRMAILAILLFVLAVLCLGVGGTETSIQAFVEEHYHSA